MTYFCFEKFLKYLICTQQTFQDHKVIGRDWYGWHNWKTFSHISAVCMRKAKQGKSCEQKEHGTKFKLYLEKENIFYGVPHIILVKG